MKLILINLAIVFMAIAWIFIAIQTAQLVFDITYDLALKLGVICFTLSCAFGVMYLFGEVLCIFKIN